MRMNVLVLTPDRVGSTLLQRCITVRMAARDWGRPVINLHELSNGLVWRWNEESQRRILGKPQGDAPWGYHQTLPQVVDMLHSADHWKTSRLAHYHLVRRRDPAADQEAFYAYLRENFYIIRASRANLLEHGLSWMIYQHTQRLNVYSHAEKLETFAQLYETGLEVDTDRFVEYLDAYQRYWAWTEQNFRIDSEFVYERDMPGMEQYITGLGIWPTAAPTWLSQWGITWQDYNRCHYLISDISGLGAQLPAPDRRLEIQGPTPAEPARALELRPAQTLAQVHAGLSGPDQQFLTQHAPQYLQVQQGIADMVAQGQLVTPVPIKLQTLAEKTQIIRNMPAVIAAYQTWADQQGLDSSVTEAQLAALAQQELAGWHSDQASEPGSDQPRLGQ